MSKPQFEVEGWDDLVTAFMKLPAVAKQELEAAAVAGANLVLTEARSNLVKNKSFDSTDLYSSLHIQHEKLKPNDESVEKSVTWGSDVEDYAAAVELGHQVRNRKGGPYIGVSKARPFLRPAADKHRRKVMKMLTDAMNSALERWGENE